MSFPSDAPSEQEVWDEFAYICGHALFERATKLKELLRKLAEQWLKNGGKDLSEKFLGEAVGEEPVPEDEVDSENHGYPRTRANLRHLRTRLLEYFETTGYLDPVIIKLNKGSYIPVIVYNRNPRGSGKLDRYSERLISRAKIIIDSRHTMRVERCMDYWHRLVEIESAHPRAIANLAFIPFALTPSRPWYARMYRDTSEAYLSYLQDQGFQPWEASFTEGCICAFHRHDWHKSLALMQTAAAHSNGEACFFWWYTAIHASVGFIDQAIGILESAVAHFLRRNTPTRLDLALLQIMDCRYGEAEETLLAISEYDPVSNFRVATLFMLLYEAQDRLDDAHLSLLPLAERMVEVLQTDPTQGGELNYDFLFLGMTALVAGRLGHQDDVEAMRALITQMADAGIPSSLELALALIGAGQEDDAVRLLEVAAIEEENPILMWYHVFPPLRHVAHHPGFKALIAKLNLPRKALRS